MRGLTSGSTCRVNPALTPHTPCTTYPKTVDIDLRPTHPTVLTPEIIGQHTGITGQHTGITGQFTGITGQFTGITGQFTGITGQFTGITGQFTGTTGQFTGPIGQPTGIIGQHTGIGVQVSMYIYTSSSRRQPKHSLHHTPKSRRPEASEATG